MPPHVRLAAVGAEHVWHRVEQRADLRVAVAAALDRLGVEPERDVVDEHAAIDLGEVDTPLPSVDKGVERPHDVVAVDTEVEREVVAGAGGHAGVRQPTLGGDGRHDRLRAIPARHRESVRAARPHPDQGLEVVTGLQLDGLDASLGRLGEREALGLPATGARVEEEHRMTRSGRTRQVDVDGEGGTRRSNCRARSPATINRSTRGAPRANQDQSPSDRERGESQPHCTRDAPSDHRTGGGHRDEHEDEQHQPRGNSLPRRRDQAHRWPLPQQGEGRHPSPRHGIEPLPVTFGPYEAGEAAGITQ